MKLRQLAIAAGATVLVCLAWAGEAGAELPAPYGETTGMVVEGSFALNGITDNDHIDNFLMDVHFGPIVGLAVGFYYRPIPYLSVGLHTHYAFIKGEADGFTNEHAGFLAILAEARGHLPMSRFDPWIAFGFGYAMNHNSGEFGDDEVARFNLHGVGIGIGVGVNIFVTQRLALAPFFRMIFGGWVTACGDYDLGWFFDDDCDDLEETYGVDDRDDVPDMPHLWVVGATVSYIFGG